MMTDELSHLPNLGPKSTKWLHDIGVETKEDLAQMGVVTAYCLIKAQNDQAGLNLLYAFYGALHNIRWNEIPPEVKSTLQVEIRGFQFDECDV